MPLHPFIVHLPIALSLLMPLIAAAALLAWWRGWVPARKVWAPVVILQAVLLASGFAALRTGEAEEERVEAFVAESTLEQHESAAKRLLIGTGTVLLIAAFPLVLRRPAQARAVALLATIGMLGVTSLALQTGKAGGELVYREGAAAAYSSAGTPKGEAAPATADQESEEDD
jgi:uncharacterized membrane protein